MYVDFGTAESQKQSLSVQLDTVYHLSADGSYCIKHLPFSAGKKVLLIVTGGTGLLEQNNYRFELKQGNVVLFCPDQDYFYYQTVGGLWNFWWFEFFSDEIVLPVNRLLHMNTDFLLERQCKLCLNLLKQGKSEYAASVLACILVDLAQQLEQMPHENGKKQLLYKAQKLIQDELSTITVAGLASQIGMGERDMRLLFRKEADTSPKQYILSKKTEMACFYLKNTNKSIEEISDLLGFSSQFHFSRVFKDRFGKSPSVWCHREI